MTDDSLVWRVADDVAATTSGTPEQPRIFLLPLGSADIQQVPVVLDGTAIDLWERLRRTPDSVAGLIAAVTTEHPEADPGQVRDGIAAFVADLADRRILVRNDLTPGE